jgi:hypothetical protein
VEKRLIGKGFKEGDMMPDPVNSEEVIVYASTESDLRRIVVIALIIMTLLLISVISVLSAFEKTVPEVLITSLGATIGALAGIVAQEK